jgi:hypothetical protein
MQLEIAKNININSRNFLSVLLSVPAACELNDGKILTFSEKS